MPLPKGEPLIALSVVVLGALVATARRVPVAAALAIVGVFAVAHDHGTASNCRPPLMLSLSRLGSWSRQGFCTSPASGSGCRLDG